MPLEPFKDKYEAFGWHVLEVNGHNFGEIIKKEVQALTGENAQKYIPLPKIEFT